jgi:hypothetical protein
MAGVRVMCRLGGRARVRGNMMPVMVVLLVMLVVRRSGAHALLKYHLALFHHDENVPAQ